MRLPATSASSGSMVSLWRDPRASASARVAALEESGVERLDIPAFLRKQAD